MSNYKSFVLGAKPAPVQKSKNAPLPAKKKVLVPKKKAGEIVVAHYDKNEPIELNVPQSLSIAYDLDCDYDKHDNQNVSMLSHSASYTDVDEDYSDANAYFSHADSLTETEPSDTNAVEGIGSQEQPTNIEDTEQVKKEVTDKKKVQEEEQLITLPTNERIKEEDQKFKDDLKAIMDGKKVWDDERVKKDPEAAQKLKNHGMAEKEDEQIEEKMKNDHAIFDKIAKSMEMAESYDLGSITIDKKFDDLEKETDQVFTKKIHTLLEDDKKESTESDKKISTEEAEKEEKITAQKVTTNDPNSTITAEDKEEKSAEDAKDKVEQEDDKILTKDFLNDLNKVNKAEKQAEESQKFSSQASFSSTISIKHQVLKSRIFTINSGRLEVMLNTHWNPAGCSTIPELNVSLTEQKNLWPDTDHGTRKFRIGGPDTQNWSNLPQGQYYLTFYFSNTTNPHCELTGTVDVRT